MVTDWLHYKYLDIVQTDEWCRQLYYDRLKTLPLKGKRVLEIGCNEARVTQRLVKNKDYFQYKSLTSIDMDKGVIETCKKIIPGHDFRCVDITDKNVEQWLDYDIYLVFYTYMTFGKGMTMFATLNRLANEFGKEVVVYESLTDDFTHNKCTYDSKSFEMTLRFTLDKMIRLSNELSYVRYFDAKKDNGFTYLYTKNKGQ